MTPNATAASILGFLHRKPMSGFELMQEVHSSIGYFWNVTRSQVYRELTALAKGGLISAVESGPRDRIRYGLTSKGRGEFSAWLHLDPEPELSRNALLLKTFFGQHLSPAKLQAFTRSHRASHAERLKVYEEKWKACEPQDPFTLETLRFGIEYERMVLGWFDTVPWMKAPPKRAR